VAAEWVGWEGAWREALYGDGGFYRRSEGPAGHFRTASHAAADVLADALHTLAQRHGCTAVVDLGAGRGELLTALAERGDQLTTLAERGDQLSDLARRGLRLHGADVVPRPHALPAGIGWSVGLDTVPGAAFDQALVVAWELLDTVPCPVLERDDEDAVRKVQTDPATGRERLGGTADSEDLRWCQDWWPVGEERGSRVEVGRPRDDLWHGIVRQALAGGARAILAVDYAHSRDDRPEQGTLAGYRSGRLVPPVADGSCDVTAHVALDAVAAAGERAGAVTVELTTQREALRELGIRGQSRLGRGGREAELLDPDGLGGFGWLLQRLTEPTTRSG